VDLLSWLHIIVLGTLFLLVLGGAALAIWLIANPKTRLAGLILLCVGGVICVVAVVSLLWVTGSVYATHRNWREVVNEPQARIEDARSQLSAAKPDQGRVAEKIPIPSTVPAKARPEWVNAPPRLAGDVYQTSVMVGPYTTRQECDAHLGEALQEALDRYAEICLGGRPAERITLPADWLRRQLVKEQWEEVKPFSVGLMTQLHLRLEFDRKLKDRVLEEHKRRIVADRLWYGGIGLAAVLAVLTGAYGYLRMTGAKA
jgi:hypothetical protein